MNLSAHVTLQEFTYSDSAVKHGINNEMSATETERAKLLCENVFEPLRSYLGKPIKINSGFRSVQLNKVLKSSSSTSQHCKGEAIDINVGKIGFDFIKNTLDFDQLIWEFGTSEQPDWVHVSFKKSGNRKQVLKATKKNGKTIYSAY